MRAVLLALAWRLTACAGLAWLAWRALGVWGLAPALLLLAVLLPHPLLALASELRQKMREQVWQPVEGRYHAYHGTPVQVLTDEQHRRWIRIADVRKITGFTASMAALSLTYPNGYQLMGRPAVPHLADDALVAHLHTESSQVALKFRQWVEREIAFPAQRERERFGIRLEAPDFKPDTLS